MSRSVKKKWIIIILILGIVWKIYSAFNGSMIAKIRCKHIVQEYLNAKYLSANLTVGEIIYNFKFDEYVVDVLTREEENKFQVIVKDKLHFLEDLRLNDSLSNDFSNNIQNIVKQTAPTVEKVSGDIYPLIIVQKDFQSGILRKDNFSIDLYNEKSEITKEEFADISNNILDWMKEENYMISKAHFYCFSRKTRKSYEIDISEEEIYISRDELRKLIKEEKVSF